MEKNRPFFQVGGNLDEDAPSYIERPADAEILAALERGELCLVLAPRQTGKSSLMVHTRARLRDKGVRVGVVDVQPLGSQPDPARWFNDVVFQIEDSLKLETDTLAWWEQNQRLGPMQRFMKFLEDVVLGEIQGDVVLFFDEIDSVLNLPFADDFFTTLRSFYNFRSTKPELKRLSFALLGVATASEFIKDRTRTPFNIGTSIQLTDFTPEHIQGFQKVLGENSHALIDRIFYWTDGQPFLVQTLAAAIYAIPEEERTPEQIDREIKTTFFTGKVEQDTHLGFMQNYLLGDRAILRKTLKTYKQVLQGKAVVRDQQSPAQNRLRLAGVVRVEDECLKPRNRIYSRIFDLQWIKAHPPSGALRLAAYGISVALLVVLAWIFLAQPLFFPRFPQIERIVRYSSDPSVSFQFSLNQTNVSHITLKRTDIGQAEEVFVGTRMPVLFQQEDVRHTVAGLERGEYQHTLELSGGWPRQTRTVPVEIVYYPNWEVKQIPDKRLADLNPIVEVYEKQIIFKDVMNGRELGKLEDFQSPITAHSLSGDRRRLLVGFEDGRITLWEETLVDPGNVSGRKVETKLLHTFTDHQQAVLCLVFSPDGRTVVSGSRDQTLKLWDVQSGNVLRTLTGHRGHRGAVTAVTVSPDGRSLFSGGEDRSLKRWYLLTGQVVDSFDGYSATVTALAVSTDGKILVSGAADGTLRWWDLSKMELMNALRGHQGAVTLIAFSKDGRRIVSGDTSGVLKMWDNAAGKEITSYQAFDEAIKSAGFAVQDQLVFAQTASNDLKTWEVLTGNEIQVYSGHQEGITRALSFSHSGDLIVSGSDDKSMRLWDVKNEKLLRFFQHTGGVRHPRFRSNDTQLISAERGGDNALRLWDIESGKELCTFRGHKDSIVGLDISPDGKLAASASWDMTVKTWDFDTCIELKELKGHQGYVVSVAFSPDGKFIASGSSDNTIKLWDVDIGKELRTFEGHNGPIDCIAFSLDGKTFISGSSDTTIKLWNVSTGKELRTLTGHRGSVWSVALSSNGKHIVSASSDSTAKLWDVATGQVLRNFAGHKGGVYGVTFSPDGKWMASGGDDGVIKIWWAAVEPPD